MSHPNETLSKLMVILDVPSATHEPLTLARAICDGGGRLIQVRAKTMCARELFALAHAIVDVARPYGARVLVNGRADVALAAGADGVHRPYSGMPFEALWSVLGAGAWVGASTHNAHELLEASDGGATFATLSPFYLTTSKPGYGPALGPDGFGALLPYAGSMPVFALGGVTPDNARACVKAGAFGVAVMGAVIRAERPERVVRTLLDLLEV